MRRYFILTACFYAIFIAVIYLGGCKENTYINSRISEVEISSTRFWVLQIFSTNNDDIVIVVIEKDSGNDKMFMNLKKDFDGSLIYNSPTIVNGKLKKNGLYVVKEKQLVYISGR